MFYNANINVNMAQWLTDILPIWINAYKNKALTFYIYTFLVLWFISTLVGKFQLVFSTYEIRLKFNISRNTYKIVKYYELIFSVLSIQVRHEKPKKYKSQTYLIFPGGWQNVHLRSHVLESHTVTVSSKLTASKEPSSEKQQLVAW